ncbi:hypothetical protein RhiXN_04636 [Rhizoctonia solani]|uniref:Uncharacterized protein n=1 Tax=Rhizoctonia solani TaxID=456999 RepID=A0A8H8NQA3_9AGAM|nr:uncharacterized protein RhiXN_04636 [Rhizoctonia solani]QRW16635.1 hypothetical protein RhiXN_04636 [Rhizoctonia solani]
MPLTTPTKNLEKLKPYSPLSSQPDRPKKRSQMRPLTLSQSLNSPQALAHLASPKVPSNPAQPSAIMVISSSQESEQIRDAGAGFEKFVEHALDHGSQIGTPKSVAMDLAEDTRPTSATPKRTRITNIRRETPLHDLMWNPQDQYWLERLEDRAYSTGA